MQTSTSKSTVMGLLSGKKRIPLHSLEPKDWVELILEAIRDMKEKLPEYRVFKRLGENLYKGFSYPHYLGWNNEINHACSQANRNAAMMKFGFPKGISLDTRVIKLLDLSETMPPSCNQEILLTDSGVLLTWFRRRQEGTNWLVEVIEASHIDFLSVQKMYGLFASEMTFAYTIYSGLCHLPSLHAEDLRTRLRFVDEAAAILNNRFCMLEIATYGQGK